MDAMRLKHPNYTFVALSAEQALKNVNSLLCEPKFFVPALGMVEAPSRAAFSEQVTDGTIRIWEMQDHDGRLQAWVFYSYWTMLSSVYLQVPDQPGFPVALTQAALEAIVPAIFARQPAENDVIVPVVHPEPAEAELMLATLGFEVIGTRPEFEAQMTSYWLQRSIWDAYFGASTSPS